MSFGNQAQAIHSNGPANAELRNSYYQTGVVPVPDTLMSGLLAAHSLVDTLNGCLGDLQGRIAAVVMQEPDSGLGACAPAAQGPEAVSEIQRLNGRLQLLQFQIEQLTQWVRV